MFLFSTFHHAMGGKPKGERLQKMQASPNYVNRIFENNTPTSLKMPAFSFAKIMWQWLMTGRDRIPQQPIPNLPINLEKIKNGGNEKALLCWLGHSTYIIKMHGKTFLIDPVFGERASMFSFFGPKRFDYQYPYKTEDLPEIDAVIFTHDHYDHLDHTTAPFLKEKITRIIAPLGVGAHLERWGVSAECIEEFDWGESVQFDDNIKFTCEPTRHFAGRGFVKRFTSLWCSWVMEGLEQRIFLGSDSGYFDGFEKLGKKYKTFDLVILECGAYCEYWPAIHMFPEETAQASLDMNAKALLSVHWAKYDLSVHHWKEPIERLSHQAEQENINLLIPQIGEVFTIGEDFPKTKWFEELD